MKYSINIGGRKFNVEISSVDGEYVSVRVNNVPYKVRLDSTEAPSGPIPPPTPAPVKSPGTRTPSSTVPRAPLPTTAGSGVVTAPIPGVILDVKVSVGDAVEPGHLVAVMEAMKMENNITAPISGTVKEIRVQKGTDVATGDVIMIIE
jgi:glutaconyl-CoA decarboxylase